MRHPNRRDDGPDDAVHARRRLATNAVAPDPPPRAADTDLVFDFTGLDRPDLAALSMVLTARLQAGPDHRVWVRALPASTWRVLRVLGLDHLFRLYPGPSDQMN